MIKWTDSVVDMKLISAIADRAIAMGKELGIKLEKMKLVMDIDATHSNGCPLKLQELLDAKEMDFAHDVFGIIRHIDRETGKLTDCFLPRYAK